MYYRPGMLVTVTAWHHSDDGPVIGTGTLHRVTDIAMVNGDIWPVTEDGHKLDPARVQAATDADVKAWRDAYGIAWTGASNPSGVALTIHETICRLRRAGHSHATHHDAVRAMVAHLDYLVGNGLGPSMPLLETVRLTYCRYCGTNSDGIDGQGNDVAIPTGDRGLPA